MLKEEPDDLTSKLKEIKSEIFLKKLSLEFLKTKFPTVMPSIKIISKTANNLLFTKKFFALFLIFLLLLTFKVFIYNGTHPWFFTLKEYVKEQKIITAKIFISTQKTIFIVYKQ